MELKFTTFCMWRLRVSLESLHFLYHFNVKLCRIVCCVCDFVNLLFLFVLL